MRGLLEGFLRSKLRVLALGAVLCVVSLGQLSPRTLLLQADEEVLYDVDLTTTCMPSGSGVCVRMIRLTIGNTGRAAQPRVLVTVADLPPGTRYANHRVLPLAAGDTERFAARVEGAVGETEARFELADFAPGTIVELSLVATGQGPDDGARRGDPRVSVRAAGDVVEASPRATAFGRLLAAFL